MRSKKIQKNLKFLKLQQFFVDFYIGKVHHHHHQSFTECQSEVQHLLC